MKPIEEASKYSINNHEQLAQSTIAGCYHCLRIFTPDKVTEYWDEGEDTGVCPHCHIDSVIGDASGYEITEEVLKSLKAYWFAALL